MEKPGETRGSGKDMLRVFHAQPGGQAAVAGRWETDTVAPTPESLPRAELRTYITVSLTPQPSAVRSVLLLFPSHG